MPDHGVTSRKACEQYRDLGFTLLPALFSTEEAAQYRQHFLDLRLAGTYPGDAVADVPLAGEDPLRTYPRMIQMHHWDPMSLQWLLDQRLRRVLTDILGREPYAAQTMIYFKPPGARGQAIHQDQYFLRVQPGTCTAAWMALERCDDENGCLQVVPGSHKYAFLCHGNADYTTSISNRAISLPENVRPVPIVMEAGDVLVFDGLLAHGSNPNVSSNRFRCSLIGHYIQAEAEKVAHWFNPLLRMDGTEVMLGTSEGGGPCGVWTGWDGRPIIETRREGMFEAVTE